jgi:hypothetical protein
MVFELRKNISEQSIAWEQLSIKISFYGYLSHFHQNCTHAQWSFFACLYNSAIGCMETKPPFSIYESFSLARESYMQLGGVEMKSQLKSKSFRIVVAAVLALAPTVAFAHTPTVAHDHTPVVHTHTPQAHVRTVSVHRS